MSVRFRKFDTVSQGTSNMASIRCAISWRCSIGCVATQSLFLGPMMCAECLQGASVRRAGRSETDGLEVGSTLRGRKVNHVSLTKVHQWRGWEDSQNIERHRHTRERMTSVSRGLRSSVFPPG